MKLFQKGVAVLLAIIISTQSTALAFAETAEPTTVQTEDGVTFTHNSDGTVTATVYPKMEVRAMSAAPMTNILEDQGDSYASTGDNISLRLEKTYTDGEMLVYIESNGAGIFLSRNECRATDRDRTGELYSFSPCFGAGR